MMLLRILWLSLLILLICAAILFSAHGRTYELSLDYPLGFEVSQSLLTHFSAIVEGVIVPPPSSQIPPPLPPEPTEMPDTDSLSDSGEVEMIDVSVSYGEVLPDASRNGPHHCLLSGVSSHV